MEINTLTTLILGAGIITQAFLFIVKDFKLSYLKKLLPIALFSLFMLFEDRVDNTILASFLAFALIFTVVFQRKIVPLLNEAVVLIWTILFWYVYLSSLDQIAILNYFTYFFALFSAFVVIANLMPIKISNAVQVLLYVYHQIIVLFILFVFTFQLFMNNYLQLNDLEAVSAFFLGMMIMSMLAVISSIAFVFSKNAQSRHDHYELLFQNFSDKQTHPIMAMIIIGILPAIFYQNHLHEFISMWGIVSIIAVATPLLVKKDKYFKIYSKRL